MALVSTQIELDRFSHLPLETLTARKNVFVQICSGHIRNKYVQTERQILARIVNTLFASISLVQPCAFGLQM